MKIDYSYSKKRVI